MLQDEAQEAPARLALYKSRKNASSQDERRRQLLEEQKRLRQEIFNAGRRLVEEFGVERKYKKKKRSKVYRKLFMYSEWLSDLPNDLEENWVMIPCPIGKRTLVVSHGGITTSFDGSGRVLALHPSLLPAGSKYWDMCPKTTTILDCIWNPKSSSYYILDVLAWNNQPFTNCDTEFRFFWLKSKLPELEGISEKLSHNPHPFYSLPQFSCDRTTLRTAVATHPVIPEVPIDGFLFYHMQAQYISGSTPLVLWLKPFMIAEFLHMTVTPELCWELPSDYKGYKQYIEEYEAERKRKKIRKKPQRKEKMDVAMEGDSPDSKTGSTLQDDEIETDEQSSDDMQTNLVAVELEDDDDEEEMLNVSP